MSFEPEKQNTVYIFLYKCVEFSFLFSSAACLFLWDTFFLHAFTCEHKNIRVALAFFSTYISCSPYIKLSIGRYVQ